MDDVASYKVGNSIIMDSDIYLYAVWARTYTVTYTDGQGGTIFENQVISGVENGASTPLFPVQHPSSITLDGETYVFAGWDNDIEVVLEDLIINAVWKLDANQNGTPDEDEARYSVTYTDGVNGTAFGDYVVSGLLVGTSTPLYNAPVRTGYIFLGWSPSVALTVTGNTVYTALWAEDRNNNNIPDDQEDTYTIFYVNGITGETLQTTSGVLSGLATPQFTGTPTMAGYVFAGWSPVVASEVDPADADTLGYIFYTALWEVDANNNGVADIYEPRYSVTYTDGANGAVFADQTTSGLLSGLATPQFMGALPTRTGYVFAGWSTEPSSTVDPTAADELGRIVYTALWEVDANNNGVADIYEATYTITYTDGANGTVFADQVTSGLLSGFATPQFAGGTPTRTGYLFAGWSTEPAQTVTDDVIYTALWVADVNNNGVADSEEPTYTITYTDGVNGAVFADQVTSGVLGGLAMPQFSGTPTREGYTFVGWSTEPAQTVSGDVTYTAIWEEIVDPTPTPGDDDDPTPTPGDDDDPTPAPGDDDSTGDNGSGNESGNGSDNGSTSTPNTNAGTNGSTNAGSAGGTAGGATGAASAGTVIADDATPLAAPTETELVDGEAAADDAANDEAAANDAESTEINDDENPLAAADHSSSWLSWLLTVGVLVAAFFLIFALVRRRNRSRE